MYLNSVSLIQRWISGPPLGIQGHFWYLNKDPEGTRGFSWFSSLPSVHGQALLLHLQISTDSLHLQLLLSPRLLPPLREDTYSGDPCPPSRSFPIALSHYQSAREVSALRALPHHMCPQLKLQPCVSGSLRWGPPLRHLFNARPGLQSAHPPHSGHVLCCSPDALLGFLALSDLFRELSVTTTDGEKQVKILLASSTPRSSKRLNQPTCSI